MFNTTTMVRTMVPSFRTLSNDGGIEIVHLVNPDDDDEEDDGHHRLGLSPTMVGPK
jgi:hypothetical protein